MVQMEGIHDTFAVSREEAIVLDALHRAAAPLGSRSALAALRTAGLDLSESTVSRLLRRLDELSLTRPVGRKGRILTAEGESIVASIRDRNRRASALREATKITGIDDLLQLLYARRAVEREAARGAALHATDADVARLREMVERHDHLIEAGDVVRHSALNFHGVIIRISANQVLQALGEIVFAPALDRTEEVLDVIIGSHRSETASIAEHVAIVDAIEAHDGARAEEAMVVHLNRLIQETESFASSSEQESLVARLLTWAHSGSSVHNA